MNCTKQHLDQQEGKQLQDRIVVKIACFFDTLTAEKREKVLVFDDSTYNRSCSKVVELLPIHDRNSGRSQKGAMVSG